MAEQWQEFVSESGEKYYFNSVTQVTQWDKPLVLVEADIVSGKESAWEEYQTDDGKRYYYNKLTQATQWDTPEEYKEFLSKKQNNDSSATTATTTTTSVSTTSNLPVDSIGQSTTEPIYNSKEDAIKAFRSLLDEKLDISKEADAKDWLSVMKKIANDERYKAIKNVNEKKAIYLDFVDMKRHQEREERRQKLKKAKEEFLELLSDIRNPEFIVTSFSSFRKLLPFLEQDARFQSLSKEVDRIEFLYWFDEFQKNLEIKEKKEQDQKKRNALEAFRLLLIRKVEQGKVNHQTVWRKIQEEVEETPEYKELDKVERLSVWDSFIREIQRIEDEKKEKEREKKRKQEIKNRAMFWKLLTQMHKLGEICVATQWRDFKTKIANNEIYKTVEQQPGPRPRHLFDEFLDDLEIKFKADKKIMKTILKERDISINLDTPYQIVSETITQDPRYSSIDPPNVKVYFDDSIVKAKEKLEHKRKKNMDKLKSLLKQTPEFTLESTYEQCKSIFQTKPEFEALTEPDRQLVFEEFLSKLKRKEERKIAKRKREELLHGETTKRLKTNEGESVKQPNNGITEGNPQEEEEDEFERELQFLAKRKEQILSHLQLSSHGHSKTTGATTVKQEVQIPPSNNVIESPNGTEKVDTSTPAKDETSQLTEATEQQEPVKMEQ